jgi:hypothetical protein
MMLAFGVLQQVCNNVIEKCKKLGQCGLSRAFLKMQASVSLGLPLDRVLWGELE